MRRFQPALALWMAVAACRIGPDTPLRIAGTVLTPTGDPVVGQAVSIVQVEGTPVNLVPPQPGIELGAAITDSAGSFQYDVLQAFTAGNLFRADLPPTPEGDVQSVLVEFDDRDAVLGPVQQFTFELQATPTDGGIALSCQLPEAQAGYADPNPFLEINTDGGLAWQAAAAPSALIDGAILEDFGDPIGSIGTWFLSTSSSQIPVFSIYGQAPESIYLGSGGVALPPGSLIPLSRGSDCELNGMSVSPCPLTNGQLANVGFPGGNVSDSIPNILIELPAPAQVHTAVLRGVQIGAGGMAGRGNGMMMAPTPPQWIIEGAPAGSADWIQLADVSAAINAGLTAANTNLISSERGTLGTSNSKFSSPGLAWVETALASGGVSIQQVRLRANSPSPLASAQQFSVF